MVLKNFPITSVWGEGTDNKQTFSEEEIKNGINFGSEINSALPNGVNYALWCAVQYLQNTGGMYSDYIKYSYPAVVTIIHREETSAGVYTNKLRTFMRTNSGAEIMGQQPLDGMTSIESNGITIYEGGTPNSWWDEIYATSSEVEIPDGAVTTPKLANGSVTSIKIAENAIVRGKIADGQVTAEKLAVNSVLSSSIAMQNVTPSKLARALPLTITCTDSNTGVIIVYAHRTGATVTMNFYYRNSTEWATNSTRTWMVPEASALEFYNNFLYDNFPGVESTDRNSLFFNTIARNISTLPGTGGNYIDWRIYFEAGSSGTGMALPMRFSGTNIGGLACQAGQEFRNCVSWVVNGRLPLNSQ